DRRGASARLSGEAGRGYVPQAAKLASLGQRRLLQSPSPPLSRARSRAGRTRGRRRGGGGRARRRPSRGRAPSPPPRRGGGGAPHGSGRGGRPRRGRRGRARAARRSG